ncbi:tail fiber domain-containing protein [Burkholderia sp. JKS000303]|uniref:tail fiber domain-containing protein n=1 Tax=Burkholderia sp. JKS000303 TaxID=1938747 RepID=UPI00117C6974|nr:tail fiber domain-containing protein [Burkholderia sp. JKS000303]
MEINTGDRIKAAAKVDGYCMELHFGGATAQGGRHAIEAFAIQDAVTSSANPDRNYVGIAGSCITSTGDGGTADDPVGKGQYFGSNFVGYHKGGRFITNVTACEFNTITTASGGNEIYIHTGIQIGSRIGVRGIAVDAQINCTGGAAGLRWRNGLMFSSANGAYSLGSDSTVISAGSQDGTVLRGIKLVPCNEYILDSGDVRLTNKSLQLGAPGASIEVGSSTAAGSSFIDLHSGGFPVDYDVRMISSGGSATNGMGNLQLLAGSSITLSSATTVFSGALRPSTDGTIDLGVASYRLGTIFAKNGAINTSDQRAKDGVTLLSDVQNSINGTSVERVFEAWADVRYAVFRFIDSVEVKGKDARWHVGVVAQQVVAAFSARGLDATIFGFLCHDVWDDEYEEWGDEYQDVPAVVSDLVDRLGDPIITQPAQRILSRAAGKRLIRAAGDLYGIRYEESHAMEVAYLRWRLEKSDSRCDEMEARIAALEGEAKSANAT